MVATDVESIEDAMALLEQTMEQTMGQPLLEQNVTILDFLLNGLAYYLIVAFTLVFLHCFVDPGFKWDKRNALRLIPFTVLFSPTRFLPVPFPILQVLGSIPFAVWGYNGQKKRGLFRYLAPLYVFQLCFQICAMPLFAYLDSSDNFIYYLYSIDFFRHHTTLFLLFFGVFFWLLYSRIYKKGLFIPCNNRRHIIALLSLLPHFILTEVIGFCGKYSAPTVHFMSISLFLFSVAFCVFVYYTSFTEHYRSQTKQQEAFLAAELAHFQQYRQMQEETRLFRHDIRNNLLCMSELLQQGKTEETAAYLNDLLQTSDTLRAKYVTGDEMLDSIVGVKAGVMQQKQIPFQLDGVLAGGLQWKPMDICNVFANALDNAIEANEQLPQEDRLITMRIKSTAQFWFIILENPVHEAVDTTRLFQRHGGFTSKADSSHHGMGTYNMKHTVEAYGGMVNAECIDRTFRLEIILDKNCEM